MDEKQLEAALNAAAKRIREGGQQAAENSYGEAYQALVRAGLRMQLRRKYRAR